MPTKLPGRRSGILVPAPVAQPAEAADLKSAKSGFESQRGHPLLARNPVERLSKSGRLFGVSRLEPIRMSSTGLVRLVYVAARSVGLGSLRRRADVAKPTERAVTVGEGAIILSLQTRPDRRADRRSWLPAPGAW